MSTSRISIFNDRVIQIKKQLQTKSHTIIHKSKNRFQDHFVAFCRSFFAHIQKSAEDNARHWRSNVHRVTLFGSHVFTLDRKALAPYAGLLVTAGFVLLGNQANQQAYAASSTHTFDVVDVAPENALQVLYALDPLTPELTEDPDFMASMLVLDEDQFVDRPGLSAMSEAETLSKKDPIPYTVVKGDTMLSIAQANNRTVATILDANGIKPEDAGTIKPGTVLLVPQEDTSHSLAWLEADQKAQAAKAEAARKLANQRAATKAKASSRERSNASYDGAGSVDNFVIPIRHNGISRGVGRGHMGIDYRANTGTSVMAAAEGRVVEVTHGWAGGFGISVVIDHGGGLTTRYAHLSDTAVSIGQVVGQGQVVAYSGNTGNSTGPHLHFETRRNGRVVSPF